MTTAAAQPSGLSTRQWWLTTACVALVWLLQLWLFKPMIEDYFPTLDKIGVRAGSTPIGGPVKPQL